MVQELNKIFVVSKYTFKEIIKSKIIINVFVLGLILLGITYVTSQFTYGVPEKTALDIGMGLLFLSTVGLAIFFGSGLVSNELETRTIYMIISRPISRFSFLVGKLLGLSSVMLVNTIILASMTILVYFLQGGSYQNLFSWTISFIFIEALILLFVVVLFSLLTNKNLTVFFSIILLFSGHAVDEAMISKFAEKNPMISFLLEWYHFVLPGFYKFNLKDYLLYKQTLPWDYLLSNLAYGIVYLLGVMFICSWLFERKDFD
jgi:ABC-type transport system involved in multi-copper enzyme maturation permease subunit